MKLVRSVGAVHVAVATPIRLDAKFGIGALEFAFAACRVAVGFVAPIVAIEFAVAAQRAADTATVSAPEFGLAAVAWSAAFFIRSISAVVIVITTPTTRYAFVVVALK